MIIQFKNLGPLKNGEIKLQKLTVIAGANNTGKTYLTYTVFGLIRFLHKNCKISLPPDISRILDREGKFKTFYSYAALSEDLTNCSREFDKTELARIFSSQQEVFESTEIAVQTEESDFDNLPNSPFTGLTKLRSVEFAIDIKTDRKKRGWIIECSVNNAAMLEGTFSRLPIKNYLVRAISQNLLKRLFPTPWISTSERLGIALFYKDLDSNRNAVVEYLQNMAAKQGAKDYFDPYEWVEKATSRFAQPIHQNINFVRNLEDIKDQNSELEVDLCKYINVMMGGSYKYQDEEIFFSNGRRGANKVQFPLHLGSSSLRSLADIFFYLKHLANGNSLLIIDEPESHLTPQNQVIFARLIGACINAGLRLMITTHSDYLIKELNNLVMLSSIDETSFEEFEKKYGYLPNEAIKPENISAYICAKRSISPCDIDKYGIEVPNIDEAIHSMNMRASHLYDILDR